MDAIQPSPPPAPPQEDTTREAETTATTTTTTPTPTTTVGLTDALLDGYVGKFYRETEDVRHLLASVSATGTPARPRASSEPALFTLPQIVVVGQESSGKSSVLESLAMLPLFPRDERICTRMPIHLKLRHVPAAADTDGSAVSRAPLIKMRLVYADDRPPIDEPRTYTPDEVAPRLLEWMRDIVASEAQKENGGSSTSSGPSGVVQHVAEIHVSSPDVPTLDLVDLPGIVASHRAGEPADMMQRTRALVEKYLKMPHTLVLAVVPMRERVSNSQAFQLVQQYNLTDHTVGVLTMVDRAEDSSNPDGPYADVIAKLKGLTDDVVPLEPHGYVAVKNRDMRQRAAQLPLDAFKSHETEWFKANLGSEFIDKGLVTSGALATKVERMLVAHVKKEWVPWTVRKLETKLGEVDHVLNVLGGVVTTVCAAVATSPDETMRGLLGSSVRRAVARVDAEIVALARVLHAEMKAKASVSRCRTMRSLLDGPANTENENDRSSASLIEWTIGQQDAAEDARALVKKAVVSAVYRLTCLLRDAIHETTDDERFHVERFDNLYLLAAATMWEEAQKLLAKGDVLGDRFVAAMATRDDEFVNRLQPKLQGESAGVTTAACFDATVFQTIQMLLAEDASAVVTPLESELEPVFAAGMHAARCSKSTANSHVDLDAVFQDMSTVDKQKLLSHTVECRVSSCDYTGCLSVRLLFAHVLSGGCAGTAAECTECILLRTLTRDHKEVCLPVSLEEATKTCAVCTWHTRVVRGAIAFTTPPGTSLDAVMAFCIGQPTEPEEWQTRDTRRARKKRTTEHQSTPTNAAPVHPTSPQTAAPPHQSGDDEDERRTPDGYMFMPSPTAFPSPSRTKPTADSRALEGLVCALSHVIVAPLVRAMADPQALGRHAVAYLNKHPLSDTTENTNHWFHETTHTQRRELSSSSQRLNKALAGIAALG